MDRRGIRWVLFAVAIGAMAAGCGSSGDTPPVLATQSAAPTTTTPTTPSRHAQQLYLKVMRALHPGVAGRSDAELLALGDQACAGFRRDDSYDTVVAGLRSRGLSQEDAVGVIVSATISSTGLCSDMNERVRKDLTNGATRYPGRT